MSQRLDEEKYPWNSLIAFCGADNDGGDNENEDEDLDDDGVDEDDSDDDGDLKDKKKSKDQISRDEYDALMKRMQAADRAKSDAEKKIREYEDKDKSELDKATRDRDEAISMAEELSKKLDEARINNAFIANSKYTWKNPTAALKLADLSEVVINEDGSVKGLDKALDALAKSDPYLLAFDDGEEDDGKPKGRTAAGGTPPKGNKNKSRREELEKRYPALRGRSGS